MAEKSANIAMIATIVARPREANGRNDAWRAAHHRTISSVRIPPR